MLLLLVLLLLQFLVFNRISFSGFVNPYVYIMFILILPYEIKKWQLLVLGFVTGLIIDMFMNTLGLHAAATLVAAFVRTLTSEIDFPKFRSPGSTVIFVRFARYVLLLVLIHHTVLFFMEAFTFNHLFLTLLRVVLSTFFTTVFILILTPILAPNQILHRK